MEGSLRVVPPNRNEVLNNEFRVEVQGGLLYSLDRDVDIFSSFNKLLTKHGYEIKEAAVEKVTKQLRSMIKRTVGLIRGKTSATRNIEKQRWRYSIVIAETNLRHQPKDVVSRLGAQLTDLEEKYDEQASKLFSLLKHEIVSRPHRGRWYDEVGPRQQERQKEQIRFALFKTFKQILTLKATIRRSFINDYCRLNLLTWAHKTT